MANVTEKHPTYDASVLDDWRLMRDSFDGEKNIKNRGVCYLPMTDSQRADSNDGRSTNAKNPGQARYERYKTRAVYHDVVRPAIEAALGIMHRRPAEIELPASMEPLRTRATFNGEGLDMLLMKINEEQLLTGRLGLMADVPTGAVAGTMPYVLKYVTESIINWDSTIAGEDKDGLRNLNFVALDESGVRRNASLAWMEEKRYKVLALASAMVDVWPELSAFGTAYVAGTAINTEDLAGSMFIVPSLGGNVLQAIPFRFIGPRDLVPEPDKSPLLPLARIALAIYRTEADRRQALHMEGQDTLVVIGDLVKDDPDQETKVGSDAIINVGLGGDAKYIGVSDAGLTQLESCVNGDLLRAAQIGGQLLTEKGNAAESGDALRVRTAARTATLHTVAQAGAAGLEQTLRDIAIWTGADPDKCKVHPNNDFADDPAVAQDLVQLMTAKMLGAKISHKSIHDWMRAREFTKLNWDEENAEIDDEEPTGLGPLGTPGKAGAPGAFGKQPAGKKPAAK